MHLIILIVYILTSISLLVLITMRDADDASLKTSKIEGIIIACLCLGIVKFAIDLVMIGKIV